MIIERTVKQQIKKALDLGQLVIVIYGPRQSGKTTLIKSITDEMSVQPFSRNGDDLFTQKEFSTWELSALKSIIGDNKLIVIDEAQRIANIGIILKLLVDNLSVTIIASGSSSFDLANKINEPLTGRSQVFQLTSKEEKENYLYNLLNNYLYKDILNFENIKKPKVVVDLLSLLALQIGKEVSVAELAQNLAISQKTVEIYLGLLEKMFVIFNLRGFSRNLRKEIYKTSKYYFLDVGLRNALIRNFNPLDIRQDKGELFENWFIVERMKFLNNNNHRANLYFWRTYDQQEIDLIEEKEGVITGFECKWSKNKVKIPQEFLDTYKNAKYQIINQENYLDFIT
ncbi:MAG: hypothetical protein UT11_C0037G0005 [Berkelbacteria bacterium GW2011_GWA2_38_9]|uniref:AAA+ ATPase domain-containing protein n=1 Tax=Berkelbacteria bacterium GW2011_GWA2_38_9 TaxID=1618334 RepID=A0A0G0PG51_9BACT|nr:MAG: hypothetical protein UT11_C0037G0005 [Berkelbacteria bacterium GW2011_GWA2_38_9]